jgi:hypothetical protein
MVLAPMRRRQDPFYTLVPVKVRRIDRITGILRGTAQPGWTSDEADEVKVFLEQPPPWGFLQPVPPAEAVVTPTTVRFDEVQRTLDAGWVRGMRMGLKRPRPDPSPPPPAPAGWRDGENAAGAALRAAATADVSPGERSS